MSQEDFHSAFSKSEYIQAFCREEQWEEIWLYADVFILITGVVANAALLWLFLREGKPMSASKVLGVNLVAMDIIYLSVMPFGLVHDAEMAEQFKQNTSAISWQHFNGTSSMTEARDIFNMFNLIGCPLLLACMCMERYLAVIRPVLYLSLRKWEYRMAVSAVVWAITLSFCLATGVVRDFSIIVIPVSIIISCLFLVMLASLGGVIWSLQQQSPAHTANGKPARSECPLKRQAVGNVLIVVVPAVMSYLPVLMIAPLLVYSHYWNSSLDKFICHAIELSLFFPRLGVFIGPLFYFSKARQMCSLCRTGKKVMNE